MRKLKKYGQGGNPNEMDLTKMGLQLGSNFGPWGAAAGAAIGGMADIGQSFFGTRNAMKRGPQSADASRVTDPFRLEDGGKLTADKQSMLGDYIYSKDNGVANRLSKRLSKLNLPKDVLIKFKGESHTGPNEGIPIDADMNTILKGHKTNVSKGRSKMPAIAKVEEGEVAANKEYLAGGQMDGITHRTMQRILGEEIVRNERKRSMQPSSRKLEDGGPLMPNNPFFDDDSLFDNFLTSMPTRRTQMPDVTRIAEAFNPFRLTSDKINPIETSNTTIPISTDINVAPRQMPMHPRLQKDLAKLEKKQQATSEQSNLTTGDKTQIAAQFLPTLVNLGRGLFEPAERVSPAYNENNPAALQLMRDRSASLTAARNDIVRQGNVARQRNQNVRSIGMRSALDQNTFSNINRALTNVGLREQQLNNQLNEGMANMLLATGADNRNAREAARIESSQNRAAKRNLISAGVSNLAEGLTRTGKALNDNLSARRGYELLQQTFPDFTLEDYSKYIEQGYSPKEIIKYRTLGLIK